MICSRDAELGDQQLRVVAVHEVKKGFRFGVFSGKPVVAWSGQAGKDLKLLGREETATTAALTAEGGRLGKLVTTRSDERPETQRHRSRTQLKATWRKKNGATLLDITRGVLAGTVRACGA